MARVYCVLNQIIIRKNALECSPHRQIKTAQEPYQGVHSLRHTSLRVCYFLQCEPMSVTLA